MCRAEGQFAAEHVIKNSFHQFQHGKALPEIGNKIEKLEQEAATLDASGEVVVIPPATSGTTPRGGAYIVDTLLHCSPGTSENGSRPKPCLPRPREKGEMHVVPVQLPLIAALSKVRLSIPPDLRPVDSRQSILLAVQELERRFPQGLQSLKDMGIEEKEIVELVGQIEELEQKLLSHPVHKVCLFYFLLNASQSQDVHHVKCFKRKADVNHEIQQLKSKMRESQVLIFGSAIISHCL
ncbi:DExH-box ATP-dependent RNA helicase DExH10 [Bienertia sinuspersici]